MLIKSIQLKNFLSFGDASEAVSLRELNVVIGPNGAGKSNLLEFIGLLQEAPRDLAALIRNGGGVQDWLRKGVPPQPVAYLEAIVCHPQEQREIRYALAFAAAGQRFEITDESIEALSGQPQPNFQYRVQNGYGVLKGKGTERRLKPEDIDPSQSILAQRRDPDQYPEITYLGQVFSKIRLYTEWTFGRHSPVRHPQKADMPNDTLLADCSNLGLVLNRLGSDPVVKANLLKSLQILYEGIDDYHVLVQGGTVQVFFREGAMTMPPTRLSDGTLRYLCLLAILCHPDPPPLVCIEEPELGLHPDVLPHLAKLLKEASQRCQLIVTTHSDVLVDAMTDMPEAVLIAEKDDTGTRLRRLEADKLKPWLEKYRLGTLWTRGDLGGTRW
jgi:predicted ATPase